MCCSCLVGIVCTRLVFNAATRPWRERYGKKHGVPQGDMKKIMEEFWVLSGNIVMLAMATYVMLRKNGGCWFGDVSPCLDGWPNHAPDTAVLVYYSFEFAWYMHLLLKTTIGYGEGDGKDMKMHHVASILLLVLSKAFNLTRGGVLVLTLFGISNPALHAAKLCNHLVPSIRIPAFVLFALTFFVTRVVLVPLIILKLSWFDSKTLIPYAVEDFYPAYILFNVLLSILYAMQIQWMIAILRVLKKSATDGGTAAAELSTKLDPAKRFGLNGRKHE